MRKVFICRESCMQYGNGCEKEQNPAQHLSVVWERKVNGASSRAISQFNALQVLEDRPCLMAFPIPAHLPRRASPQDISSQILSKIDAATNKSLTSTLATSWLTELDDAIQSSKERIHKRVQADLPEFKRQLELSKSIQTRLLSLTSNVDALSEGVSNPQTGIVPTLIRDLGRHAELAQESLDASVKYEAISHLQRCLVGLKSLESFIEAGKLPDAVQAQVDMDSWFEQAPVPLNQTDVMLDAKRKLRAAKARTEEQLNDAYSRSVVISPHELIIYSSVQVRRSETVLSLPSILSSLTSESVSNHLTVLRRDLTTYFIDHVLKGQVSILTSSGVVEHKLSHMSSSPSEAIYTTRLENLSAILTFLSVHFFPNLPPQQQTQFTRSLCKPITTSLLNNLLIPVLPSSFDLLPPFLELVERAAVFEERFVVGMLGNDANDRPVKAWADGACGHYERQRRKQILDSSRTNIISSESSTDRFLVDVEVLSVTSPENFREVTQDESKDDAWGFDDDVNSGTGSSFEMEADGWGFDDEVIPGFEPEPKTEEPSPSLNDDHKDEPSSAWGWDDNQNIEPLEETEETAWDDPWGDEPSSVTQSNFPPAPSVASPKVATRLEKAANKGKKRLNEISPIDSPEISIPLSSKQSPNLLSHAPRPVVPNMHTPSLGKQQSKGTILESYSVSGRMKRVIRLVEDVLNEGKQFAAAKIVPPSESTSAPGSVIFQSASSILDLHMALYPVKFSKELTFPERGVQFSNDCLYLSGEVERLRNAAAVGLGVPALVLERLSECTKRYKLLADSWFYDVIERQRQTVDDLLVEGAHGFIDTGDQDRYDECENAISQVLQEIRRLAQRLKGVLTKSKYYTTIGMVTDAALSRILQDVLALPDIPEMESHRLSELCRILNALEGLFVEDPDPNQPSFVVAYVPSWLKFSYLSELLEASMADITYLFEESALVDFEVDELVRLVRALFADTALISANLAN